MGPQSAKRTSGPAAHLPATIIETIAIIYCFNTPIPPSTERKHALSHCKLICKYWAIVLHFPFLRRVGLQYREDVDRLFVVDPCITRQIRFLDLELGPTPVQQPWLHHACLQLRRLIPRALVSLAVTGDRTPPSSEDPLDAGRPSDVRRLIPSTLPPCVPAKTLHITHLSFERTRISSTASLGALVAQLQTVRSCACRDVVFDSMIPAPRLRPRRPAHALEVSAARCALRVDTPGHRTSGRPLLDAVSSLAFTAYCPADVEEACGRVKSVFARLVSDYNVYEEATLRWGAGYESLSSPSFSVALEATISPANGATPASVTLALYLPAADGFEFATDLDWTVLADAREPAVQHVTVYTSDISLTDRDPAAEPPLQGLVRSGIVCIQQPVVVDDEEGKRVQLRPCTCPETASRADAAALPETHHRFFAQLTNIRRRRSRRPVIFPPLAVLPTDGFVRRLPGHVVPQKAYTPSPAEQADTDVQPPWIPFFQGERRCVRLQDALGPSIPGLEYARVPPLPWAVDMCYSGTLHVRSPGDYSAWAAPIVLGPMQYTVEHVLQAVARLLRQFYEDAQQVSDWTGPFWLKNIEFGDLYVMGLRHVSKGHWQPVVCCKMR